MSAGQGRSVDKSRTLLNHLDQFADCTAKCKSSQHAAELISAVTKSCQENVAIAWIARHCHAPARARDSKGRSLLHVAASLGKVELIDWILKYKDGAINGKDKESGYSALHRAIFYGQIQAVIHLIKQGANLALIDNNGLTAIDHALHDRPPHVTYSVQAPLEAYVWGTNSNYNLGTGDNSTRNNPDLVEEFRKLNVSVKKIALQKFHSAFITNTGAVYTCGHGRGGRLGIGSETILLTPKSLQIGPCVDVALGVDHSVFLCESGIVYTCGENTFHQLGHQPPPPRLLAPAPVGMRGGIKQPAAVGVAAGRYHSVFWTEDAVYTWGLNAGQLGHIKGDKTIILPKVVTSISGNEVKIEQVCVSDGSTVVYTNKGDVMALYGYTTKKLGIRQQNVQKIQVVGGHLDPAVDPGGSAEIDFKLVAGGGTNLRVFILRVGKLLVWEEGRDKNFLSCTLSISRSTPVIMDFCPFRDGLILVSEMGETWCGSWPTNQQEIKRSHSPTSKSKEPTVMIKLRRIAQVYRGVAAVCDPKGRNFGVLQVSPREALTEIPEISASTMTSDLDRLLAEVSEFDSVFDTVCLVKGERFPAHSFVLASGSEALSKQLRFAETLNPTTLTIDDIHPVIFQQILKYLYTKSCDLLMEGPCTVTIPDIEIDNTNENTNDSSLEFEGDPKTISAFATYEKNRKKKMSKKAEVDQMNAKRKSNNPLNLFLEAGKLLGVYGISKLVDCFRYGEGRIYRKSKPPRSRLEFSFKNLTELCDVTIETEDEEELYAHKSILVARSEYFMGMFSSGWLESSEESSLKLQIKAVYVECILEYLYKDDSKTLNKSEDTEFISNLLVYADQLLIVRLKEMCENQLSKLMTLKNVASMLEFAFVYQAEQLKRSCLQFVCINLPCLLENKGLENLEPEVLYALDAYYRESNPRVAYRKITPESGYPSQEEMEMEYAESPITSEDLLAMESNLQAALRQRPRRHSSGDGRRKSPKLRQRTSESSVFSSSGSEDEDAANISQDFDKLSVLDFEIEENDEALAASPDDVIVQSEETQKDEAADRDTSYFSSLLGGATPQNSINLKEPSPDNASRPSATKTKKFPKLSQKERKRQSVESAADSPEVTSPKVSGAAAKPWGGWNATGVKDAPASLSEIMQMQGRKETKERKFSESDSKEVKKTSWRQIDWTSTAIEKATSPTKAVTNPWNIAQSPPQNERRLTDVMNAEKNQSFSQIMAEDVKERETLVMVQTKPLHLTQLEERAMEELRTAYELQHPGDVITVARVQRGNAAAPVWRKTKN